MIMAINLDKLLPECTLAGKKIEIKGLALDSRSVLPGYLFAALNGETICGSSFIETALTNGAAAILTDDPNVITGEKIIFHKEARRILALAAARFYGRQPKTIIAVTGTNGKSSVVDFVRQIWQAAGLPAASIGTLGVICDKPIIEQTIKHTTPDPITLHSILAKLQMNGIEHVALEASSHGLAQKRLDGVHLAAAAFTNISRDHLDYHHSMEEYAAAKQQLFARVLPVAASAIINTDCPYSIAIIAIANLRRQKLITIGPAGSDIALLQHSHVGTGQNLTIAINQQEYKIRFPLFADFQVSNALIALALAIATGVAVETAIAALKSLRSVSGRMELIGKSSGGAMVFVDYAHTPGAMEKILHNLKEHCTRRLIVVFGAGGNRDIGKRKEMGEIAARYASRIIITDDNPRDEDSAAIRRDILRYSGPAIEIADRREAIIAALSDLEYGDVVAILGKGHESGQIIKGEALPFDDRQVARNVLLTLGGSVL